ncbi:MAG TPA: L,D-transpeptidase [Verrucomicrobium sp.]|nr:L,D-transpeptidase [Verrucomicrobium sp.]
MNVPHPRHTYGSRFGRARALGLPCVALVSLFSLGSLPAAEEPSAVPLALTPEMESMLRWQIFLDHSGFSPGKIDGKDGQFTKTAKDLYAKAHASNGGDPSGAVEKPVTTYVITKEDVALVGECPSDPKEQSKLTWLPYASLPEVIAQKFHCGEKFFRALNADKVAALKEGDEVRVPNVEAFSPEAAKAVKPGEGIAAGQKLPIVRVRGDINMLQVESEGKVLAAYPVTIGSEETVTAKGEWKIKGMERLPKFRRDQKMLKEGERSSDFVMIPPGPNNPVGVLWIEIDKEGLGIHGTDQPDSIGRSASHGCIRLANWDVVRLAKLVKGGVKVIIE